MLLAHLHTDGGTQTALQFFSTTKRARTCAKGFFFSKALDTSFTMIRFPPFMAPSVDDRENRPTNISLLVTKEKRFI